MKNMHRRRSVASKLALALMLTTFGRDFARGWMACPTRRSGALRRHATGSSHPGRRHAGR
jgi:hypothetical protein